MSRPKIATLLGLLFILGYVIAVISIPDLLGRQHWAIEAVYWCIAGIVWVLPIRWLMLWSVYKR